MKIILSILLMLCSISASADTLGLHIGSRHSKPGFNNVNPGLYYKSDSGLTAGFYCNSESKSELFPDAKPCQISKYAGYTFSHNVGPVELSATAGVIVGYKAGPMPMILPTIATAENVTIGGFVVGKPRLAFIPRIDPKRGAHVVHLMLERQF